MLKSAQQTTFWTHAPLDSVVPSPFQARPHLLSTLSTTRSCAHDHDHPPCRTRSPSQKSSRTNTSSPPSPKSPKNSTRFVYSSALPSCRVSLTFLTPGRRNRSHPQGLPSRLICCPRPTTRCPRQRHQEMLPHEIPPHPSRQDLKSFSSGCL